MSLATTNPSCLPIEKLSARLKKMNMINGCISHRPVKVTKVKAINCFLLEGLLFLKVNFLFKLKLIKKAVVVDT